MLALQTLDTLRLVFLDLVHLLPDSVLLGLHLGLLLVLLSLTVVLIDALVKIVILDVQVLSVGRQQLTRQKFFQDFGGRCKSLYELA